VKVLGVDGVAVAFAALGYAGTINGNTGRVSPWLISANILIAIGEIADRWACLVNRLCATAFGSHDGRLVREPPVGQLHVRIVGRYGTPSQWFFSWWSQSDGATLLAC
jgi:hypothetical protein